MPTIGTRVLSKAMEIIKGHVFDYKKEINEAYNELEGPLPVTLKATFKPGDRGVKIDTSISFTTGQVKDTGGAMVDEMQRDLFANPDARRQAYHEILFRDYSELRHILMVLHERFMVKYRRLFVFNRFKGHAL